MTKTILIADQIHKALSETLKYGETIKDFVERAIMEKLKSKLRFYCKQCEAISKLEELYMCGSDIITLNDVHYSQRTCPKCNYNLLRIYENGTREVTEK